MKNIRMLFICICASLFIACTNQGVYETLRQNQLQECRELASSSAYEKCAKQYSESYEEYDRKRNSQEGNNT